MSEDTPVPEDIMDELISHVAEELRGQVPASPDFDARVMARVCAGRRRWLGGLRRVWMWLRRPRTLRLSPLGGLALALVAVLAVIVGRTVAAHGARWRTVVASSTVHPAPVPAAAGHGDAVVVRFVFLAPSAHSVAVAGDFNNWSLGHTMMRRVSPAGLWTVDVSLRPGRYTYTFVVDGTHWRADPAAPREIADDFGAPSSVLAVTGRGTT